MVRCKRSFGPQATNVEMLTISLVWKATRTDHLDVMPLPDVEHGCGAVRGLLRRPVPDSCEVVLTHSGPTAHILRQ